jgi:uncharacterized tellurite resistance protein B-like protein
MQTVTISPAIAGYQMLMILAEIDGHSDPEEQSIIKQYINEKFPMHFRDELQYINATADEDDFLMAAMEFHQTATDEEKTEFLQFAFDLIKADSKITREENRFINLLYDTWQLDTEDVF